MKQLNRKLGQEGEKLATEYLMKKKYRIVATDYACPIGEIDIIAIKRDCLVFVEVKTRSTTEYGLPCEAVTPYKQNKIRKVAEYFMLHNGYEDSECHFDVIEIVGENINHIENCF